MHFYSWVIVIALLILLGSGLKRAWFARQENGEGAEEGTDAPQEQAGLAEQWTASLFTWIEGLKTRFSGTPQADTTTLFRDWAVASFTSDREIQGWLASLTDEQIGALAEHLAEFCRDMGFELSWLLENQSAQNPDLMEQLGQIILLYSRASYQAVTIQEDVEFYRIYHDLIQNPKSRANRKLNERLFGQLVEQGMSDVTISEHLASSERKRQQQILETIQNAAKAHPQVFNRILKTVLMEQTTPVGLAEGMAEPIATHATNGTMRPSNHVAGVTNGSVKPAAVAGG